MKKLLLFAVLGFFALGQIQAQEGLGATAGLFLASAKVEYDGYDASDSETGFYAGVYKEFGLNGKFAIRPGVNLVVIDGDFGIQVPAIVKYYVADGFNIQAGPQLLLSFEDTPDDYSSFNISLGVGAGYDFTEKWGVEARYGFQLNNYYTGDIDDVSSKLNALQVGATYNF